MQDDCKLNVHDDVIAKLLPKTARGICQIQKAFLIDACRGRGETKNGDILPLNRLPSEGGWILAYSTLPQRVSEGNQEGSYWLTPLVGHLRKEVTAEYPRACSFFTLLGDASYDMLKSSPKLQLPVVYTRMFRNIFLSPRLLGKYIVECAFS